MDTSKNPKITCRFCKKDIRVANLYHHISLYHFSDFWDSKPKIGSSNREKLQKRMTDKWYSLIRVVFKQEQDGDDFWFCPSSLTIYRKEKMAKIALDKDKDKSLYKKNAQSILNPQEGVKVVVKEVIREVAGGEDFSKERESWIKLVRDLMQTLAEEKANSYNQESKFDMLSEMCMKPMFDERGALSIVPLSPKEMGVEKMDPDPELQRRRECLMKPLFTSSQIYHIYGDEKEFQITHDDIINKEAKALFKKYSEALNPPPAENQSAPEELKE